MDDYLKSALEIVQAQAKVRVMSEEEITAMVAALARTLRGMSESPESLASDASVAGLDPKKSVKEKSIICLECGKSFKILTKKHLASHGLTPVEYREKHGMKKGAALAAKGLQRDRRKKMKDMKLWERRKKTSE